MNANKYEEAPHRESMRRSHYSSQFEEYDKRQLRMKVYYKDLTRMLQKYINQPADHFWGAVKKKYDAYENGCYIYEEAAQLLDRPDQLYRDSYWVDENGFIRYKKKELRLRRWSRARSWARDWGVSTKAAVRIIKKARKMLKKEEDIKLYEATEATLKERKLRRNNEKRISNSLKKQ